MDPNLTSTVLRHPDLTNSHYYWTEWRETFTGGEEYRDRYLKQWSSRETDDEFAARKSVTPIPTFAKGAILDIRNAIFQRLEDVSRLDGSQTYMSAVVGEKAGVDRKGTSMNSFIGIQVLTELLVMGKTGIYVDAPNIMPQNLFEQVQRPDLAPYCYSYRVEDILSYEPDYDEVPGTFRSVLLRDYAIKYNTNFGGIQIPSGRESRRRLVWRADDGLVRVKFFEDNDDGVVIPMADGSPEIILDIPMVPFILPDIGESLMMDIASYQHALMNILSGDVNWDIFASSPFLTIQRDMRSMGAHSKKPGRGNTPEPGGQRSAEQEEQIGAKGRYYDLKAERPGYISPPTEPLEASLKLQEKLEDDIRRLINLAVVNKQGSRTESAEAKKLSSQGLEAGLSFIGNVLQDAERHISKFWAMYEGEDPAAVAYPTRYILKQDSERIEEATNMAALMDRIPSKRARKEMAKDIVNTLLGGRQNSQVISAMMSEIDAAGYTSGVVMDVIAAVEKGLVGDVTASDALGYDGKKEVPKALKDKAKRAEATLLAQTAVDGQSGLNQVGAGARGVKDIDPDEDSAEKEKDDDE